MKRRGLMGFPGGPDISRLLSSFLFPFLAIYDCLTLRQSSPSSSGGLATPAQQADMVLSHTLVLLILCFIFSGLPGIPIARHSRLNVRKISSEFYFSVESVSCMVLCHTLLLFYVFRFSVYLAAPYYGWSTDY